MIYITRIRKPLNHGNIIKAIEAVPLLIAIKGVSSGCDILPVKTFIYEKNISAVVVFHVQQ